jgi:hypothetical protein
MISIVEHVIDFDTINSNYIPKNKNKVLVMQRGMDGDQWHLLLKARSIYIHENFYMINFVWATKDILTS